MKQALIDIGSNSMRLTLYETRDSEFKILFREKVMAGLAGYVSEGTLSMEGLECACNGLLSFQDTLRSLSIGQVTVFATASLRNIKNTDEAVAYIRQKTGWSVEVIGGEEEALLGFRGAMEELTLTGGCFLDIGGASTEIVAFRNRQPVSSASFSIGSLSLYRDCVKQIIPGKGSRKRLEKAIKAQLDDKFLVPYEKAETLACVGGTARAVLKLAKKHFQLDRSCRQLSAGQLSELCDFLLSGTSAARELILRVEPERIHTMIPGIMILQHLTEYFQAERLYISSYGVREGYLCRLLSQQKQNTNIHRTEN